VHERLAAQLRQAEAELDDLELEIDRETGIRVTELREIKKAVPTADEVRRLRFKATQYADADASAVRECEELEERHKSLSAHLTDLIEASEPWRPMMETADVKRRWGVAI